MISGAEAQKRVRRRKQAIINAYKASQGCRTCGERDLVVLDLHHRKPGSKNRQLRYRGVTKYAQNIKNLSFDDLREELTKCDVLCANCHRRETYRQHQDGEFGEVREPEATLFDTANEGALA